MIKTNQLQLVLAIENSESLAEAAEVMHLSVSAITKAMKNLELELDMPLLDRTGYRVTLNEYGRYLASHARNITSELEDTRRNLLSLRDSAESVVRISASPALMNEFLPKALSILRERIPGALVHLDSVNNVNITAASRLASGLCDLAISPIIPNDDLSQLKFEPFARMTLDIIASEGHPARQIKNPTFAQLVNYDWVLPSVTGLPFEMIQTVFRDHGVEAPTKIHLMPTREMLINMLEHGEYLGVSASNKNFFSDPVDKKLEVEFEVDKYGWTQYLFQRRYSTPRPVVAAFLDVIKEMVVE